MDVNRRFSRIDAAYVFAHFSVDFACVWFLCAHARQSGGQEALLFLFYTLMAFGLQPFIGWFCDGRPRFNAGAIGCALTLIGLFFGRWPWVGAGLMGLGNALFHVGGGRQALMGCNGRMTRAGLFVSSGAPGVTLGTLAGVNGVSIWLSALIVALSGLLLLQSAPVQTAKTPQTGECREAAMCLLAALVSVAVRAWAGGAIPSAWRDTTFLLLLSSFSAMLGKAAGGALCDRFGVRRVGTASLALSIPFLLSGSAWALVGILLLNATMTASLFAVLRIFPDNPGFAFGLTTLALLLGSLPAFPIPAPYLALILLVAAACLYGSVGKEERP